MTVRSLSEGYRIKEIVGQDTLESVRPLWEQWQTHPNADFDYFSVIVKNRERVDNPIALLLLHNEIPVAMAAGRIEKVPLPVSLGYLKVSRRPLVQVTLIYGGLMGAWGDPGAMVFVRHLRQMMRRGHIKAVHFAAMRHDSPVYKAVVRYVPFYLRDTAQKNNAHWWADLTGTLEGFQKKINRKHRAQLRSKERQLAQCSAGIVRVKIFQTPEEVSLFCATAEEIARATYLRGLGKGFYCNEEMRNRLRLAADKGWMRGYVLYANEKPCAFWLGTLYLHVFYLDFTGFDAALRDCNVGQILFIKMVEDLFAAGDVRGMDFGFGDAIYKQQYGTLKWEETALYLFNNTPGMVLANLVRKTGALLSAVTEKTLKRFDLFARIKKHWRRSLEHSASGCAAAEKDTITIIAKGEPL